METGFSATPIHGLELCGGAPAAHDGSDQPVETGKTDAIPAAPTTDDCVDEQAGESEHVISVSLEPTYRKTYLPHRQYKRQKDKIKKQPITVVFNESKMNLTDNMVKVLNKVLKFAITPLRLDITQVLTEFKRFERTMVWQEFSYGRNSEEPYKPPLFKQKKSNFPRNHRSPKGLQDYLTSVKSELLDPKSRHQAKSYLTEGEKEALKQLVRLPRDRTIVIRPCDKGAGIIIIDFKVYIRVCQNHLESTTNTGDKYYVKADTKTLREARDKMENIVKEGFDNEILNKEEYTAMLPGEDEKPGRFYATFKVHKDYTDGTAPPERAIVSGSGTFREYCNLCGASFKGSGDVA